MVHYYRLSKLYTYNILTPTVFFSEGKPQHQQRPGQLLQMIYQMLQQL
jgi:hypothetical protein